MKIIWLLIQAYVSMNSCFNKVAWNFSSPVIITMIFQDSGSWSDFEAWNFWLGNWDFETSLSLIIYYMAFYWQDWIGFFWNMFCFFIWPSNVLRTYTQHGTRWPSPCSHAAYVLGTWGGHLETNNKIFGNNKCCDKNKTWWCEKKWLLRVWAGSYSWEVKEGFSGEMILMLRP